MDWWQKVFNRKRTGIQEQPVEFDNLAEVDKDWYGRYMELLLTWSAGYPYAVARILEKEGVDTSWFYLADTPGRDGVWPSYILEAIREHHEAIYNSINDLRENNKEILEEGWVDDEKRKVPSFVLDSVQQFRRMVSDWPKCEPEGLPYRTLTDYYPVRTGNVSDSQWKSRKLIWDFKYDIQKTSPLCHAKALSEVLDWTEKLLEQTFGTNLQGLVFVCIPASSQQAYTLRFHEFSTLLCQRTGMMDAWPHISIRGQRGPVHKGEHGNVNIRLDRRWFKYRKVLLFDDVMTTGRSFKQYADIFDRMGAFVIGGVFIGKTVVSPKIHRL